MSDKNVLDGVTVVDLTTFLSGPYATQILADLGAEVIKIENPKGGDPTRILPPHFVHGDSAYFHSINRNKKSVAIDLKRDKGQETFCRLIESADVLIDNFRPGVMDRLGLTEERLKTINPGLVWCSLTGFGASGPYRNFPAYDMVVQALSGGMSLTGERDGPSVRAGVPIGDLSAGMFSVIGILAALNQRHETGRGRRVDVSMLDCQISMLCYQAQYTLVSGEVPGRQGMGHDSIPTYRSFRCCDGKDIVITANNERMWQALCETLDCPELIDDERFLDNTERLRNKAELWVLLEAQFARHDSEEIFPKLMAAGVPAAPINNVAQALNDPQVQARKMLIDATAPDGRTLKMAGNPIQLDGASTPTYRHPPRLAEDTREVLKARLGLSNAEIDDLAAAGFVKLETSEGGLDSPLFSQRSGGA